MHASAPNRLFHAGPLAAGGTVRLDRDASHHALRVLRLAPGDAVELFDGGGLRWPGRLLDAQAHGASVALGEPFAAGTESPLPIGLAQALPSGDKMDWVVEKAVELGVVAIQPLFSRRSLIRLDGERAARRVGHWRRIAIAACMQCGRDRLPEIGAPVPITDWIAAPGPLPGAATDAPALRWVLSPRGAGTLSSIGARPTGGLWLLAGPEGGLSEDEEQRALSAGWTPLRLGPRVLRTETAGMAAAAALQARFGDLD
jgi:16S rRNA (uracil1498-N3)-methyltransferase